MSGGLCPFPCLWDSQLGIPQGYKDSWGGSQPPTPPRAGARGYGQALRRGAPRAPQRDGTPGSAQARPQPRSPPPAPSSGQFAVIYQQGAQPSPRRHQQSSHLEKLLSEENMRVRNDRDLAGEVSIAGTLRPALPRGDRVPCEPAWRGASPTALPGEWGRGEPPCVTPGWGTAKGSVPRSIDARGVGQGRSPPPGRATAVTCPLRGSPPPCHCCHLSPAWVPATVSCHCCPVPCVGAQRPLAA